MNTLIENLQAVGLPHITHLVQITYLNNGEGREPLKNICNYYLIHLGLVKLLSKVALLYFRTTLKREV